MKPWLIILPTETSQCMVRISLIKIDNLKQIFLTSVLSLFCFSFAYAADSDGKALSKQRRAELHNLLIQDCGSCHAMTMKGGLGPALTPEVLSNKPRQMIEMTIRHGRPGTPMPPWSPILSKEEISWLVDTLYSGVRP